MPFPVRVAGGEAIAASWGNNVVDSLPVIGVIEAFAGDTAPVNWLLCRGQAVSRASYPTLFTMVSTRFGAGDGTTTFNVPDMRGRYPVGFNQGGSWFSLGVGERYGTKDGIVAAHQHGFSGTTAGANARHNHNQNVGEVYRYNPFAPVGYHAGGSAGNGSPFDVFNTNVNTGTDQQDHAHDYSGATTFAGQDATNANLPPSMSLNFIIRVT